MGGPDLIRVLIKRQAILSDPGLFHGVDQKSV